MHMYVKLCSPAANKLCLHTSQLEYVYISMCTYEYIYTHVYILRYIYIYAYVCKAM